MNSIELQEALTGNPLRAWMIYEALFMELRHGIRLTARAPTGYTILKREFGFRGSREKVFQEYRKILRDLGILHDANDRETKREAK